MVQQASEVLIVADISPKLEGDVVVAVLLVEDDVVAQLFHYILRIKLIRESVTGSGKYCDGNVLYFAKIHLRRHLTTIHLLVFSGTVVEVTEYAVPVNDLAIMNDHFHARSIWKMTAFHFTNPVPHWQRIEVLAEPVGNDAEKGDESAEGEVPLNFILEVLDRHASMENLPPKGHLEEGPPDIDCQKSEQPQHGNVEALEAEDWVEGHEHIDPLLPEVGILIRRGQCVEKLSRAVGMSNVSDLLLPCFLSNIVNLRRRIKQPLLRKRKVPVIPISMRVILDVLATVGRPPIVSQPHIVAVVGQLEGGRIHRVVYDPEQRRVKHSVLQKDGFTGCRLLLPRCILLEDAVQHQNVPILSGHLMLLTFKAILLNYFPEGHEVFWSDLRLINILFPQEVEFPR